MPIVLPAHIVDGTWPLNEPRYLTEKEVLDRFTEWYAYVDDNVLNPTIALGTYLRFPVPYEIFDAGTRGKIHVVEMRLAFHAVIRIAIAGKSYNLLYVYDAFADLWILTGRVWGLFELQYMDAVTPPPASIMPSVIVSI